MKLLWTSQETLPFVSWLVFDPKVGGVFGGFGLHFCETGFV